MAVSSFVCQHVDRWHELLLKEHDDTKEWSESKDFGEELDRVAFDIMGDLSFGKSFDTKEPGGNSLREVPHNIIQYLKFYYPVRTFLPLQLRACSIWR
jgi:hypothetical protein